ncbi:multicopper oxidase family protein [Actinomadura sp. ATCC 31491]|uniref:Multicopper oxidase family protein n=1 Tax=Actinomadura luzonensis TaxID=2805427 RepID=A0ABT0G654_9ACTN|nr:multicopper oxidase family protein [Actinomadura luzonensis]MCK2220097.1 multicopper oxidase family protein [Actinomadura luzonensis]
MLVTGAFAAGSALTAGLAPPAAAQHGPAVLRPRPSTVTLGRRRVRTWTYNDELPGPTISASTGDIVHATLVNDLPEATTVHWHGIQLDHRMDGAPGYSQKATPPGGKFPYVFRVPFPGTYFYHSHVGMQADRGLYGPLIVHDPREPLSYDEEYTVVLDDWLDGLLGTPDEVLRRLNASTDHDDTLRSDLLGGVTGDVRHPLYLVNGRPPEAPATFSARPGRRVRFRVINAAADTAFRVALGGHRMTVTHADGCGVRPVTVDTFLVGMGERYDFLVRLGDGVFPLVAMAEGKGARAFAVVRTSGGRAPGPEAKVPQLDGRRLAYRDLQARTRPDLPKPERTVLVTLGMRPSGNEWTMNDRLASDPFRLRVDRGETIRVVLDNQSPMWHPMHLHGHTFQLRVPNGSGPHKDTVNVKPRERVEFDVLTANPGEWMFHCHNLYHQEQGMMGVLGYGRPPRRRAAHGHH